MEIRRITEKDIEDLYRAFLGKPYNKPLTLFKDYFNEQKQGKREVYIALDKGRIVGYATLVWESPYPPFAKKKIPEIKDLNVIVEYRRGGYGTRLIEHIEKRLYTSDFTIVGIGVGVTPDYEAARSLYPKLGYIPDGLGVHPDEEGGTSYFTKTLKRNP